MYKIKWTKEFSLVSEKLISLHHTQASSCMVRNLLLSRCNASLKETATVIARSDPFDSSVGSLLEGNLSIHFQHIYIQAAFETHVLYLGQSIAEHTFLIFYNCFLVLSMHDIFTTERKQKTTS